CLMCAISGPSASQQIPLLFDHLGCKSEQISRNCYTETPGCPQVDAEIEFDWILHRKLRWAFTFHDSRNVGTSAAINIGIVRTITNYGTLTWCLGPRTYHCEFSSRCRRNYLISMVIRKRAGLDDYGSYSVRAHLAKNSV